MVSVDLSPSGRDALYQLPSEAQRSGLETLDEIESNPHEVLNSDYGFQDYYCRFNTTEEEYVIVARWLIAKDLVRIINIGPADSFCIGN